MTQKTEKQITLKVRQVGDKDLKKIVRSLKSVKRQTKSIASNLRGLRSIFFTVFGGLGIREIFNAADSIQLLEDRIKVFTGSAAETESALNGLFDAANLTNTSVDSLAETFNRIAIATKELGLSTNELVGFTATLQNTFRLSGATIAESTGAAIQLSQALASGQLRGQELRSVLEANAIIGGILAKELGTTRGQLIKFAESGKITSDVVLNALSKNAVKLNEDAQKLGQTFGQTLIKAFNEVKRAINQLNKDFELNKRFAESVGFLADNLDRLARSFAAVGGVVFLASLGKITTAIVRLLAPINILVAAVASVAFYLEESEIILRSLPARVDNFFASLIKGANELFITLGKEDNVILKKLFGGDISGFENNIKSANDTIAKNNAIIAELDIELSKIEKNKAVPKVIDDFANLKKLNLPTAIVKISDAIKILNKQLADDPSKIAEYRKELNKIRELDLEKRFEQGNLTAIEFRNQLIQIRDLNDKFKEKVFTGFTLAAVNYSDEIGSLTSQLQKSFEATFKNLEDNIFNSLKKGKFLFQDFAQFVLDELTRVAIRSAIIAPFTQAFAGAFNFGGSSANIANNTNPGAIPQSAKGNVFSGGRQMAFANGGILNNPTLFPLSSGMGLAGEAGPEAIVPLTRTSDGDLGIKSNPSNVIVNVNNNAGVEVDVQSNQIGNNNVLDVTITRAVNRAISSGQLDRSLSSNYGLNRKGTR